MPAINLLNILALSTLATLLCTFAPSQTLALSIQPDHLARQLPNHHGIARKKRGSKRCKPRPSSSTPQPTNTPNSSNPKGNVVKPSSSSTQPPKSVETKTPTTATNGKKWLGVAWALGNDERLKLITASKHIGMIHIWSAEVPPLVKASGVPASIMLWGPGQDKIDQFVKHAQDGYARHVFGFNEVNEPKQANLLYNVPLGVKLWNQYIRPLGDKGYTLGSPCASSNPNGKDWMDKFLAQCGGDCGIDEIIIHWYDVEFTTLVEYVEKWSGYGKPMRLTEFACQNFNGGAQPSTDHIWDFTTKVIEYCKNEPKLRTCAPFGFMDGMDNVNPANRLFASKTLSDLGWAYVN